MQGESELVCIYTAQGWDLAQIYKSKLDAADIPALLKHEAAGLVFGITIDGLGAVDILVPAEFASEARKLLAESPESFAEESDEALPGESQAPEPENP
jgi:hypothetical protein